MATSRDPLSGAANDPQSGPVAVRDPFDVAPRHPDSPPTLEEHRPAAHAFGDISSDDEVCVPPIPWNMGKPSGTATVEGPRLTPITEEEANAVTSPGQKLPAGVRTNRHASLRMNLLSSPPSRWKRSVSRSRHWLQVLADAVGFSPMDPTLEPEQEYREMKARTFGAVMLVAALVAIVVGLSLVVYVNHVHTARREAAATLVTEALTDSKVLVFGGLDATAVLDTLDGRTAKQVLDQRKEIQELRTEVASLTEVNDSQKVAAKDDADTVAESSPEPPTPDTAIVRIRRSSREPPTPDTAIVRVRRHK